MTQAKSWGDEPPDTTRLDEDELAQLIPTDVATRADLNAVERDNILAARLWAFTGRGVMRIDRLFDAAAIDDIHRRMFANVWRWAGKRRVRATNIGVDPAQIMTELRNALDDARFWHNEGVFGPVERAVRLHHRLVVVHPYVNGNGRHARFVADLYLHLSGETTLPWKPDESDTSTTRAAYVKALRLADQGDYAALIAYASDPSPER